MATYTVTTLLDENDPGATAGSPGGYGLSLREAIGLANGNATADTIEFFIGGTITLGGTQLEISSDIAIDGDIDNDGKSEIVIDANNNSRVFQVLSGTSQIEHVTLTNGNAIGGGGINIASGATLDVVKSTISNNSANGYGGAIYSSGTLTLTDSTVTGNYATSSGGAISVGSATGYLTLTNTTVSNNSAVNNGGAIEVYGGATLDVYNSTISGNYAAFYGGGIFNYSSTVNVVNSIVLGNSDVGSATPEIHGAYNNVGSISLIGGTPANVFAAIDGSSPSGTGGMLADNGGAVQTIALLADAGNPALDQAGAGATIDDARDADQFDIGTIANTNGTPRDLGAFELQVTNSLIVTTTDDTVDPFDGETSLREAVMFANNFVDADGNGSINDTIYFANGVGQAFENGGTITLGGTPIALSSDITINASSFGAAPNVTISGDGMSRIFDVNIYGGGNVTLYGLQIVAGSATNGGGIHVGSGNILYVIDSIISDNVASGNGGGIYAVDANGVFLTQTTISDNTAAGNGGGIYGYAGSYIGLGNSTISGNSSGGDGGGISASPSTSVTLSNVTISNNTAVDGGGIHNDNGNVTITNSTISGNYASGQNGGIENVAGSPSIALTNSIVSGNDDTVGAANVNGAFINTNSIIGGTPADIFAMIDAGSPSGTGGQLANNGGRVQTIALKSDPDNPALDASAAGAPNFDARFGPETVIPGLTVPGVNARDLGAFELQMFEALQPFATLLVTTTSDVTNPFDGETTLREALLLANGVVDADNDTFDNDTILFAGGMGEAFEGGGTIVLADGELKITEDTTIIGDLDGDEKPDVTVNGNYSGRVFSTSGNTTTLEGLTIIGGQTASSGAGVLVELGGTLNVVNSVVAMNTALGFGGGIYASGATLNVTGSTISGNYAQDNGGGISVAGGSTLTINNSTLSNNVVDDHGGGLEVYGNSPATLNNVTISGNYATENGGGIYTSGSPLTLNNVTISGNAAGSATGYGGAIRVESGTVTVNNSIVSGNSAYLSSEIDGGYTNTGGVSIIGGTPANIFEAIDAGTPSGTGGLLADNGGPVQTIALLANIANPALDASDPNALANDARGAGKFDIATIAEANGDIRDLGAFERLATNSFVVDDAGDTVDALDGVTTLREAIMLANGASGPNSITFANGVGEAFEFGGTIVLGGSRLQIDGDVEIEGDVDGDGIGDIVINANSGSGVLLIQGGTATIGGVTLTGGNDAVGGGIQIYGGARLELGNSTITGNYASVRGGGIHAENAFVTLTNTTINANTANDDGGGFFGNLGTTLEATNTTISANSAGSIAGSFGGGIRNDNGTTTLVNSTVSGNYAYRSGGIDSFSSTLTLINTIVLGNGASTNPELYSSIGYSSTASIIGGTAYAPTPAEVFAAIDGGTPSGAGGLLASNGGPVQTIALLNSITNPALDAATSLAPATDARGEARFDIPRLGSIGPNFADIGAFELIPSVLTATANGDILLGTIGPDTFAGLGGGDLLIGFEDNDMLSGDAGDDVLIGNAGTNQLDGGADTDTVDYGWAPGAVSVSLAVAGPQATGVSTDTLISIENLDGSTHGDKLTGDSGPNTIRGYQGDDTIDGGAGDDFIGGGADDDDLDGGADNDTAAYLFADYYNQITPGGVTVSLALQGAPQNTVSAGMDTLNGFENLLGSLYDDTLTGDGNANVLNGFIGADQLFGGGGDDTLTGDGGNNGPLFGTSDDMLFGEAGDDTLLGGPGNDLLDGGADTDTADYSDAPGGVKVRFIKMGMPQDTLSAGFDTLVSIENVTGSAFDDVLRGDGNVNVIEGGAGADELRGGPSDDTLMGGPGDDFILGGGGSDTAHGGDDNDTIRAEIAWGDGGDDMIRIAAEAHGGDGDDDLRATVNGAAQLFGDADNDSLLGGTKNDTLNGGTGNDFLRGGEGKDVHTGGSGADTFRFNEGEIFSNTVNTDRITDYDESEGDRINLVSIDAIAGGGNDDFVFIGNAAFSSTAGELRWEQNATNTFLMGDTTGDGVEDFMIRLDGLVTVTADNIVGADVAPTIVSIDVGTTGSQQTIDASGGAFIFTDDRTVITNVELTGFGPDDVIEVTNAISSDYSYGKNGSDIRVTFNNGVDFTDIVIPGIGGPGFVFDYPTAIADVGYEFIVFA